MILNHIFPYFGIIHFLFLIKTKPNTVIKIANNIVVELNSGIGETHSPPAPSKCSIVKVNMPPEQLTKQQAGPVAQVQICLLASHSA